MKPEAVRYFLTFLSRYWLPELGLLALMVLSSAGSLATPYFLKVVIDQVFPNHDYILLEQILINLVCIYLIRIGSDYAGDRLYVWISTNILADIRTELFGRVLHYPLEFFGNNGSGETLHRLDAEVGRIQQALAQNLTRLLNNLFMILGLAVMLSLLNVNLFVVSLIVYPFIVFDIRYFAPRLRTAYEQMSRKESDIHSFLSERLNNIKLIKIFNACQYETDKLRRKQDELTELNNTCIHLSSLNRNIATFWIALGPLLILWRGGLEVIGGTLTIGALVAFLQYLNRLYNPSIDLINLYTELQRIFVSMNRLYELVQHPMVPNPGILQRLPEPVHQVRFEHVYFQHQDKPILQDCSLTLEAGREYALVGASGCGKSTLMSLLCRFYTPQSGRIYLNDTPIEQFDLSAWTGYVTLVSQDTQILHDSLLENIRYNSPRKLEAVEEAMAITGVDRQVNHLKKGMQTLLGERGSTLSGGQSQRIAITRALLKQASILILDESTAAIDSASEHAILQRIRQNGGFDIIIFISHRLSTIRAVDEVIFLDKGQVAERGSHYELVAQRGQYYELFRHQLDEPELLNKSIPAL
jgi:ABC-type bacteriocin/lantibiotic exporter with double-glycine peptidase domain